MPIGADSDLEFQHWLDALSRRALVFFAVLLAVLALGAASATLRSPEYEATAGVSVGQPATAVLLIPSTTAVDLSTELRTAQDTAVVEAAEERLGPDVHLEVAVNDIGNSLEFTATGGTAGLVADAANAYARAFIRVREARLAGQYTSSIKDLRAATTLIDQRLTALGPRSPTTSARRQSLEDQREAYQAALERLEVAAVLGGPVRAQLVTPASPPSKPSNPSLLQYLAYALLAGLLLAAGVVALLEFRDKSISGPEAARTLRQVPVLATVPRGRRRWMKRRKRTSGDDAQGGVAATGSIMLDDPRAAHAESFRSLRATLTSLMERSSWILQVTSVAEDDGAAVVATNLAIALAQGGERTTLVDLNCRSDIALPIDRPDWPLGPPLLSKSLWTVHGVEHLRVLPPAPEGDAEDLTPPVLGKALAQLLESSSYVVVLSPPVLSSSAALHLTPFVDARVLCVRPGATLAPDLERVTETLTLVDPGILGIVLT